MDRGVVEMAGRHSLQIFMVPPLTKSRRGGAMKNAKESHSFCTR